MSQREREWILLEIAKIINTEKLEPEFWELSTSFSIKDYKFTLTSEAGFADCGGKEQNIAVTQRSKNWHSLLIKRNNKNDQKMQSNFKDGY